ncbi:MAG: flagellar biosynthesis anti-sigma factor FlgM [Deltaproteobacteria bacterium]|nr:flagellar biosynthesis anti-sigma factor FlgM [Deltaproteobacteria bacterium]
MKKNSCPVLPLIDDEKGPSALTREERVEAIKQAVAAGAYRVDDRTLADCLLRHFFKGRGGTKRREEV